MIDNRFISKVRATADRIPLPINTYPGLALTGARVVDLLTNPRAQVDTQLALHRRFGTPALLSAMDLSAEAEAFGSEVHFSDDEIPRVVRPLVESEDEVRKLRLPTPGDKRTSVHLESVRLLRQAEPDAIVLGESIGPFSLAGQLLGLERLMTICLTAPAMVDAIVEKTTAFLTAYMNAFASAGADAVIMAEPSAGLISPPLLSRFSSRRVAEIRAAVERGPFRIFLHNCSARLVHLPNVLEAGAALYHFGAPMDIAAALERVPEEVVLAGNINPVAVFCQGTVETVVEHASRLLAATAGHHNFVPSSGCDVPPGTPLANLEAFYAAVSAANRATT